MPIPFAFDFKKPDYIQAFEWREANLKRLKKYNAEDPNFLSGIRQYYRDNPAQFIIDWGITYDPRNVAKGLPALIPFLLFPKQEEWVHWFMDLWKRGRPGITEKSRDMGVSWLCVALACTNCLFMDGVVAGFGSRKQEYVDEIGKPNALLYKARQFITHVPVEFRGIWNERKHTSLMRISLPLTGSMITGEAGDNIGRGDRTSYYNVDESAWLARPHLIEASLSQTTNFRHDLSTPHGKNNPFAKRRFSGNVSVFTFHWKDDPRKDEAWYVQTCKDIDDPIVIAQELDLDYSASVEGVIIPAAWIEAAVDAHIILGLEIKGPRYAALDIADEGVDKNAFCGGQGVVLDYLEEWSGKGSDIYATVAKAATLCDALNYEYVVYDSDGLGAGARGDARIVNEKRKKDNISEIDFRPFRGSGEVRDKDKEVWPAKPGAPADRFKGRLNGDYFGNAKSQEWAGLAKRFRNTYRAVVEKQEYDPLEIISISSAMPDYLKLVRELSQPTRYETEEGKIYVDKKPEGMPSPNYADACMMYFAKVKKFNRLF